MTLSQTSGCSHTTPILYINYTNSDVRIGMATDVKSTEKEGLIIPKYGHILTNVYISENGQRVTVTSGAKVVFDQNVTKEEFMKNTIKDIIIWEIK